FYSALQRVILTFRKQTKNMERRKYGILNQKRIGERIANEILMLLRSGKKYSREVSLFEPIGVDKDGEAVSLVDVIEMENKEAIEDLIFEQDVKNLYRCYEQCLKGTEKEVIGMRYGLYGKKEHTQREIAQKLGISRSYVSRIEKKALEKLRAGFEKTE
ncbi:MAG: sigma factor-like helix-turn-helix DNA-binding protein, partial [Lachnospiraceae bacterium]|nr:sigma factor-like helix-turn-helix DNA-binding protein [Lachnospiraceae bacterium]